MKGNNGNRDHTYIGLQISLHTWLWTKRPTCQLLTAKKLLYCICYTVWIDWHMMFALEPESGSLIAPMALAHPLHPTVNRSRNRRRNLWVGWCVSPWWPLFPSRSSVSIYMHIYIYIYIYNPLYTNWPITNADLPHVIIQYILYFICQKLYWTVSGQLSNIGYIGQFQNEATGTLRTRYRRTKAVSMYLLKILSIFLHLRKILICFRIGRFYSE